MEEYTIQFNGETFYFISKEDVLLLKDEIPSSILVDEIKRRIAWVIEQKREDRWNQFRKYWTPILMNDGQEVPVEKKDFVDLVISRVDYLDRDGKDAEYIANLAAKVQVQ